MQTLEEDLRRLAEDNPEIVELHEIGRSVEDRPLWALRIGERRGTARKVAVLGCHHAREWVAVEVPYLLAEHLVDNASTDPVRSWLQQGEVWVAPMVNPDGHEHTRTAGPAVAQEPPPQPRRQHRRRPQPQLRLHVGHARTSTPPATSRATRPTSARGRSPSRRPAPCATSSPASSFGGVLTYHSYSQLILYPWGYTADPVADDADLRRCAGSPRRCSGSSRACTGGPTSRSRRRELYPTAGDTTDWAYGEYDVPSFTVELRPATALEGGFILPADQIQPCWEENRPAALEFLRHVLDRPEP